MVRPRYSLGGIVSALESLGRLVAVDGDAVPEGGLAAICCSSVLRSAAAAADAWAEGEAETASSLAPASGAAGNGMFCCCGAFGGACAAACGSADCGAG